MIKAGISILALIIGLHGTAYIPPVQERTAIIREARETLETHEENEKTLMELGLYGALTGFNAFTHGGSSSLIQSIQRGSVTISALSTTGTATISSVSTTQSLLFYCGRNTTSASAAAERDELGLTFTDATTITGTRASAVSIDVNVGYTVVEFVSGTLTSNQSGSISLSSVSSNTATISSVTTTNSAAMYLGNTYNGGGTQAQEKGRVTLTDATTVTFNRSNSTNTMVGYYQIAEFASGKLNSSTQSGTISMGNGVTSNTATITSVTTGQSMISWGGWQSNHSTDDQDQLPQLTLTNGTTVTLSRVSGAGTASNTTNYCVIEFKAANIQSIQRGTVAVVTSTAQGTATISSVTTAKTLGNWLGVTDNVGTTDSEDVSYTILTVTNSTTLTVTRGSTSSTDTPSTSYEAVEWV